MLTLNKQGKNENWVTLWLPTLAQTRVVSPEQELRVVTLTAEEGEFKKQNCNH